MESRLEAPALDTLRAALLALLVHVLFFGLLALGLRWNQQEPEAVMADLWSDLPAAPRAPAPPPEPLRETRPEPRPQPRVEAKVETPRPDIALKAHPEPKKPEPRKVEPTSKAAAEVKPAPRSNAQEPDPLQQQLEMIERQQALAEAARAAAASQSVIGDYKGRIKRKIRGLLNRQPCGDANVQLEFDIALLPTGQLRSNPVLSRSSGIPACDRAVEYAIVQADPLPVPPQPEIFQAFRNLHLIIRPNDPND